MTALGISQAIQQSAPATDEIYVCGGGVYNQHLMQRLNELLSPVKATSTEQLGVSPDWVEAICFAWLAKQTLNNQPSNLPSVTGAGHNVVLGGIYWGA